MQAKQAKQIPISELLARLNIHPVKESRGELWYLSPFRKETEASFKLSKDGKAWFDHGLGKGGNVLDFVMQYEQTDVRGALQRIEQLMQGPAPAPPQNLSQTKQRSKPADSTLDESSGLQFVDVRPLTARSLIEYLKKRGIDAETARPWLQEVHYTHNGRDYFALGFANQSGGYELRNPYFKGTIGTKDISLVKGAAADAQSSVSVFEGFSDFLSAIQLAGHPPRMDCVILNSVAMQEKAIEAIRQMNVERVHLYLDRDEAGRTLTHRFYEALPDVEICDESTRYQEHKDLNGYLMATRTTNKQLG